VAVRCTFEGRTGPGGKQVEGVGGPAAVYREAMAYYIFNVIEGGAAQATRLLRSSTWAIGPLEPHRDALAPGDVALVYLAAPERVFIGRAELASAVHDLTPAEAPASPGNSQSGVALTQYEEWDPPVPISAVLSRIDQSGGARADFEVGVVQITSGEYETALSVATGGAKSTA
jgi:hypothetical protein